MNTGPLNEEQLEWLDEVLLEYGNDESVLDISELDGMLTAVLSGPTKLENSVWLTAMWGGQQHIPRWADEAEEARFTDLLFQHKNDIAERLSTAPDQFDPLFGYSTVDDEDYIVVEEWCFGYLRGVGLDDWSTLPETLLPALDAIALHASEEGTSIIDKMTPEEYERSQAVISPAALQLYGYWSALRKSDA